MSNPKFKVGDKVILGKHTHFSDDRETDWSSEGAMDKHVGKEAVLIQYRCFYNGHHTWDVDLTAKAFFWREEAMTLTTLTTPAKVAYGRHCNRCQDWNEYIPSDQKDYKCYGCRN